MKHFKKFFSIVLISVMALSTINVAFAGDLSYNSYIDTSSILLMTAYMIFLKVMLKIL